MSSGKKGKKTSKKSTISLGEWLSDGNAPMASQVQVAVPVKPRDWADECDDDDDDRPVRTQMIALPTAPRATRLLNDDTVPHNPPFQAYMSNLPYDLNEDDVYVFFDGMEIASLRLPRDDSDSGRLRGFGYVEFANRQDLIDALSIPEPMLNGRRIRIDFSSEGDRNRNQRNNRYNNDNYGGDSDRPMGNWRDGPRVERDQGQRRPYNSYNRDRGDRDGERGDSDRGNRYGSSEGGSGGNWRLGDRPSQPAPSSPPSSRRGFDRGGAERVGDRGGFRRGGPDRSGDRGGRREMEPPMERPKLVLQPRTLPLPEKPKPESEPEGSERDVSPDPKSQEDKENEERAAEPRPKPTPVPAAKLFGDAKPVDTAAKLREIEERLQEKERQRKAAAAEAAAAAAAAAASTAEEDDGKEKSDPSKDESGEEHSEGKPAAKKTDEVINWRVRSENDQKDRGQSPSRRYTKRNDDYSNFSDNRDRDNRDRRDNRNMRDNRRDYNRPNDRGDRSGAGGGFRAGGDRDQRGGDRGPRDDRDRREHAGPRSNETREAKPIEERMPKFQEPTGPNLSMANTFEGLSADEVDD